MEAAGAASDSGTLAEPRAAAAPLLIPAPAHRIQRLEALLGKERSEHAVLKRQYAACRSEISDLQMSLWGRGEGDETLASLRHHIKELQAMIWQVSNALSLPSSGSSHGQDSHMWYGTDID